MLPLAEIDTEASACQEVEPPVTVGAVGSVRSIRSVACTQFERRPSAVDRPELHQRLALGASPTSTAPAVTDDQVVPPSVDVRYS